MPKITFKFHWSFIVLGILFAVFGKFVQFLCYVITILIHELGHYFMAKKFGYNLNTITFMPYGAGISGKNIKVSEKHEFLIAIAGPLVNFAMILLIIGINHIGFDNHILHQMLLCNTSTLFFNLLPVYPLDGGRCVLILIRRKVNDFVAFKIIKLIGIVITGSFFALFFISYFYSLNYMLGINGIFLFIGLMEDDSPIYYFKIKQILAKKNILTTSGEQTYKLSCK